MPDRAPRTLTVTRRDVSSVVWRGLGLSLLIWLVFLFARVSVALPVVLVVGFTLSAARRLGATARPEPDLLEEGSASASNAAPDRALAGFLSWQDRLSWAVQDPDRFEHGVRPNVVQLADRLLAERHAISRATHPELARRLMGEPLWSLATLPPPPSGMVRAIPPLPELVRALERL